MTKQDKVRGLMVAASKFGVDIVAVFFIEDRGTVSVATTIKDPTELARNLQVAVDKLMSAEYDA